MQVFISVTVDVSEGLKFVLTKLFHYIRLSTLSYTIEE